MEYRHVTTFYHVLGASFAIAVLLPGHFQKSLSSIYDLLLSACGLNNSELSCRFADGLLFRPVGCIDMLIRDLIGVCGTGGND